MQSAGQSVSRNLYNAVHISGGVVQLGDRYISVQHHGPPSTEVAQIRFLDSIRYPEMRARFHEIAINKFNTFEWFFSGEVPVNQRTGNAGPLRRISRRSSARPHRNSNIALTMHSLTDFWPVDNDAPDYWEARSTVEQKGFDNHGQVNAKQQQSSTFIEWLKTGAGFFLIEGKPGSGKSTFMKFIFEHKATIALLREQYPSKPVRLLFHSFWRPGASLQRNQKGFFASLLSQLVSSDIQLLEVCEDFPIHLRHNLDDWSESELSLLLRRMLSDERYRTCLFIDGIDEMQSADSLDDFADLYEFLIDFVGDHGTCKVCVSSRPAPYILHYLRGNPVIILQDLTSDDIYIYTYETLMRKRARETLTSTPSIEDIEALAQTICTRAQGVFLWVHYVLTNVCKGFMGFDNISELTSRIENLPSAMEELYRQILDTQKTTHPIHSKELRTILCLGRYFPMPLFQLASAVDSSFYDDYIEDVRPLDQNYMASYCSEFASRLSARTAGLVEVTANDYSTASEFLSAEGITLPPIDKQTVAWRHMKVQFFHRTVHDYLRDNESLISEATDHVGASDASYNLLWIQSYLMCMVYQVLPLTTDTIYDLCWSPAWSNQQCLSFIEIVDDFCYRLVYQRRVDDAELSSGWFLQLQTVIDKGYPVQFIDFASLMAVSNPACLEYLLVQLGTDWSPYYKGHLARAIVNCHVRKAYRAESSIRSFLSAWQLLKTANADLGSIQPYRSADGFLAVRSPAVRLLLECCLGFLQKSDHVMIRVYGDTLLEGLTNLNIHDQYLTLFWNVETRFWSASIDTMKCVALTFSATEIHKIVLDTLQSYRDKLKFGRMPKSLSVHNMRQIKDSFSQSLLALPCKIYLCIVGYYSSGISPRPSFYECPTVHEKQILDVVFGCVKEPESLWDDPSLYNVSTKFAYDIDFEVDWDSIVRDICPLDPEQSISAGEWREKGILREYFSRHSKDGANLSGSDRLPPACDTNPRPASTIWEKFFTWRPWQLTLQTDPEVGDR